MEETNFDRKKVIADMEALKSKVLEETTSGEIGEGQEQNITVKYLGKIGLQSEQGEIVDKDWYAVIEQDGGQVKITYYAENQIYLGYQMGMDGSIQSVWEIPEKMKQLKKEDIEEAKTLEELEEEQKQENQKQDEQAQEPVPEEEQQLPGLQEGPQLTSAQVDRMKGPKVNLINQVVDGVPLGNVIGLSGVQMQLIDAEIAKQLIPDLQIPTGQRTVPIEIFSDGSANVIGDDKLQFSTVEGTNSTDQHVTTTNEGTVRSEQNLETYNIVSTGGMHTIAIGKDENGGKPYELKYGRRSVEEHDKISYTELETVHEGPLQQDDETYQAQRVVDGVYKGQEDIEEAIEKYAIAMNIKECDEHGYPTGEYDLVTAKQELERRWSENPDLTLEELIDEGQKQQGPEEGPRSHY